MNALVGKYFIGDIDGVVKSGRVEAVLNDTHYLVRYDNDVFTDPPLLPASLAVVGVYSMTANECDGCEGAPSWNFFDSKEERAAYHDIIMRAYNEAQPPRVVPIAPKRTH
jgi:hypothetical protein